MTSKKMWIVGAVIVAVAVFSINSMHKQSLAADQAKAQLTAGSAGGSAGGSAAGSAGGSAAGTRFRHARRFARPESHRIG